MYRLNLDVKHLQMIAALTEVSRVSDAAELLRITPSALSHRIREVERRLGTPLFTRVNRRLKPTAAADYLAQVASRILLDLKRAEEDVRKMASGVRYVVRIAVESYSAYHWLPAFVHYLREIDSEVGIEVVATASRNTLACLHQHLVDMVIISGEVSPTGINLLPLFKDELRFITSPDHRLADKSYIQASDLIGEDFITYTRIPEPDREYALFFRPNNAYPNWVEKVEVPEAIVEMVAAGLGCSILAGWAVKPALKSGRIVGTKVGESGLKVAWYAATRAGTSHQSKRNIQIAELFADWCKKEKVLQGN